MCFDAVREGSGLQFSVVQGVFKPQESELHFYTAGP